jgi:hypothetical protein
MVAANVVERMRARTELFSLRIRALRPKRVEVETPHFVICCGCVGGGMGKTRFSIRAGKRNGRF